MKDVDLNPLEDLFRAEVFRFLKREGKISDELISKLLKWRNSGFSVDNGKRIEKDDKEGREAIVQYMMRNVFSTENINYIEKTGKVIYRTGKMQGKRKNDRNRKNFSVYDAKEFIAAITQRTSVRHITKEIVPNHPLLWPLLKQIEGNSGESGESTEGQKNRNDNG